MSITTTTANDDNKHHFNKLSRVLHSLWVSNKLCDVHLYCEGVRYVAHKLVLIANCTSFRAKALNTKTIDVIEIRLCQSTKQGITQALSYLYTSEAHIHAFNFADILITSNELGVDELFKKCVQFVGDYTRANESSEANENNISAFGRSLTLLKPIRDKLVYKTIMKYIASNFDVFMESDEFLELDVDILYSFLACYELVVNTELELLYGILKWLNKSPEQRECYKKALLVRINYQCISPDELKRCGLSNRIMKIPEISKKVAESYSIFSGKKSSTVKSSNAEKAKKSSTDKTWTKEKAKKSSTAKSSIAEKAKKSSITSSRKKNSLNQSKKSETKEANDEDNEKVNDEEEEDQNAAYVTAHEGSEGDVEQEDDEEVTAEASPSDDNDLVVVENNNNDSDDVYEEQSESQSEQEDATKKYDETKERGFFRRKAHKLKKMAKTVTNSVSNLLTKINNSSSREASDNENEKTEEES